MKPWKYMLLAAGLAGIVGLFLPLVEVSHGRIALGFSAQQLTFGMEKSHKLLDAKLPKFAEKRLPTDVRSGREDARLVAEASRGAAVAFAPAVLLFLVGAVGLVRRRFGRILGGLALVLGLASIGAWIGLRFVIRYALDELALQKTSVALQLGAHVLLVVGALGVLAGIGALVSPETLAPAAARKGGGRPESNRRPPG